MKTEDYQLRNILVATDFSPAAWQAVKISAGIAGGCHCKVHLIHVHSGQATNEKWNSEHSENVKDKMIQIANELSQTHNIEIQAVTLTGNVTNELNRYIEKHKIDMVLMGANSSFDSHVGSHTTLMIESSEAPVLVIPPTLKKKVIEDKILN